MPRACPVQIDMDRVEKQLGSVRGALRPCSWLYWCLLPGSGGRRGIPLDGQEHVGEGAQKGKTLHRTTPAGPRDLPGCGRLLGASGATGPTCACVHMRVHLGLAPGAHSQDKAYKLGCSCQRLSPEDQLLVIRELPKSKGGRWRLTTSGLISSCVWHSPRPSRCLWHNQPPMQGMGVSRAASCPVPRDDTQQGGHGAGATSSLGSRLLWVVLMPRGGCS